MCSEREIIEETWEKFSQGEWQPCQPNPQIEIKGQWPEDVKGGDILGLYASTSVVMYDSLEDGDYIPQEGDFKVFRGFEGFVQGGRNVHYLGWYIKPHR